MQTVINTNLYPISHRCQVIADYWSHFRFRQGVSLFNTLIEGNSWTHDYEIWPQETRNIDISCSAKGVSIFWTV